MAAALVLSLAGGCVILSQDEANELAQRIRQTHAYSKRIDETVRSRLVDVADESARTRANTEAVMEELRTELQKTQSVVEENTFRLSELSRKLDELRVNLYRKLDVIEGGMKPVPEVPGPVADEQPRLAPPLPMPVTPLPVAPARKPADTTSAVSPTEDYQRAYRDYQRNNYELAKLGFKQYLAMYPDSEDADNAQFWLAQCYYKSGDNRQALAEIERLYKDFPRSPKIPDAMLIEAFIDLALGDRAGARTALEKLIANYPTADAAVRAKTKLDAIRAEDTAG